MTPQPTGLVSFIFRSFYIIELEFLEFYVTLKGSLYLLCFVYCQPSVTIFVYSHLNHLHNFFKMLPSRPHNAIQH